MIVNAGDEMTMSSDNTNDSSLNQSICYHCGKKTSALRYCETWRVNACQECMTSHHLTHHKTCKKEIPRHLERKVVQPTYFRISLTRYDGHPISFRLRLGDSFEMEEHWLGTYILAPQSLVLVCEDISAINESILAGLRSVK
jgi:hypothetical protein